MNDKTTITPTASQVTPARTTLDDPKPSELALEIALQLYPNGLPNVSYCWDSPEKNEASKQEHRDAKAREIDTVLTPAYAALVSQRAELIAACEAMIKEASHNAGQVHFQRWTPRHDQSNAGDGSRGDNSPRACRDSEAVKGIDRKRVHSICRSIKP